MQQLISLIVFLSFALSGWAQQGDNPYQPDREKTTATTRPPITDRLWVGGSMGAGFSNVFTFIDVSPKIGYMLTDRLSVGPGFSYQFLDQKLYNYSTHIYGPNVFARYQLFDFLFLHGEYEHLYLRYKDDLTAGGPIRVSAPGLYAGAGLSSGFGGRSMGYFMVLYNFNETIYTPSSRRNPVFQLGFQFGL